MVSLGHEFSAIARALRATRGRLREALETAHLTDEAKDIIMPAIDDLTTAVGNLEAASTNAVNEIATLKAANNDTALEALAGRVNTVATNLTNAVTPPA